MIKNSSIGSARVFGLAAIVLLSHLNSTHADVSAVGNTNPAAATINNTFDAGGDIGGDLIIGDTGVAGLFMDAAPPLFGTLAPLEMENGIIGNLEGSIGAVTLDDFGGGDFIVNVDFIVANEGQAFLDLFDSASVTVTGRTTVGLEEVGTGVATINGQGSRIITDELYVGDLGYGQLDLTDRAILVSGTDGGDSVIGNDDSGVGIISLTGIGTRWNVGSSTDVSSLFIGNAASVTSDAQGTLRVINQALVQVSDDVVIGRLGRVELQSGGRMRMLSTSSNGIFNDGVVLGDGHVDFVGTTFVNGLLGEIRNTANAVEETFGTNQPEKLIFTGGLLTNNGTIESLGGEMEFNVPVVNNFEIVARDAVLRFPQLLFNDGPDGIVVLGGDTTVHGFIDNTGGGSVELLPGSDVAVIGDLTFSTASIVSLVIGDQSSNLFVSGVTDLGGAFLELNYTAGDAPQVGDSYEILNSAGGLAGAFGNTPVAAGGALWDIVNIGDSVFANFAGIAALPVGADFNGDGVVDGADLQIWQDNFGRTSPPNLDAFGDADGDGDVDGRDFLRIQQQMGGPGVPLVAGVGAIVSVPEPSALVLLLSAAVGLVARRKR